MNKVVEDLMRSLDPAIHCSQIDPSQFMLSKPEPVPGAANNGDTLPILFFWLLNHFTKSVVEVLQDTISITPQLADPTGVMVVMVFSKPTVKWRGASMIDVFMARLRKVAPALFGYRGDDDTDSGRAIIGWKKFNSSGGTWADEQVHFNRMTGFARGYAAISLRDFSASQQPNPWAPWHYWQTLASLLSTPPRERTRTVYTLVTYLVSGHEGKFVGFYGSAAVAMLRYAVVEFSKNPTPQCATAAKTLATVGSTLERDYGLTLQ
jgi:nucleoporin GLE1